MCGRYGRRADKQRIAEWFQTHNTNVFDDEASYLEPSYSVAPQTMQPVVRLDSDTGERELTVMRWGLVPHWSKDGKVSFGTINAKSETVATSPAFREAWKYRRCPVPDDWFYEWQKLDEKTKQPYAIAMKDDGMFAFAGLWGKVERQDDRAGIANVHNSDRRPQRTDAVDSQSNAGDYSAEGLRAMDGSC